MHAVYHPAAAGSIDLDTINSLCLVVLQVTVWYNTTQRPHLTPPNLRLASLLNAAVRGWAQGALGGALSDTKARAAQLLGLMSFPKAATTVPFDL